MTTYTVHVKHIFIQDFFLKKPFFYKTCTGNKLAAAAASFGNYRLLLFAYSLLEWSHLSLSLHQTRDDDDLNIRSLPLTLVSRHNIPNNKIFFPLTPPPPPPTTKHLLGCCCYYYLDGIIIFRLSFSEKGKRVGWPQIRATRKYSRSDAVVGKSEGKIIMHASLSVLLFVRKFE